MMTDQFSTFATQDSGRRLIIVYCRVCERMFGKTISVMAGEAQQNGKWYGPVMCVTINWMLRDPEHCAQELNKFNAFLRHRRFLLGIPEEHVR